MDSTKQLFTKIKEEQHAIRRHQSSLDAINTVILEEPGFENYGPQAIADHAGKVEKAIMDEYNNSLF